jgi:chorismate dehydratase
LAHWNQNSSPTRPIRLGGVSYLNSKPLLYGLDRDPDIQLTLDVPARLLGGLRAGAFDVALLPVIDLQKMNGLSVVPSGGIGSDGPTLTVRIFSSVPLDRIETLACDPDSHTSVVLAQIILARRYGLSPRLTARGEESPSRLLIGDKVVCEAPSGLDYQLDLGQAWKELTGLPFVFAVWTAAPGVDLGDLPQRLLEAKREGLAHLDEIVEQHAVPRGWPAALARQYLGVNLCFDIAQPQLKAISLFHQLAAEDRLISQPPRPLILHESQRFLAISPPPD